MSSISSFRRRITLILLLISAWTYGASAQLSLVSFSPADGATSVALDASLSFTFSAPIDTTVHFRLTDGFFIAAEIFPEPDDPLDIRVSADRRTIDIDFLWQPDTRYVGLLSGATGDLGESLDRPYAFTFSTGPTLPGATVSGTANFGGDSPNGAVVTLLPAAVNSSVFDGGNPVTPAAWTVVTDASGAYTVPYVPAGEYLVVLGSDVDGDGDPGGSPLDDLSLFDSDTDGLADHVILADGESATGIDLVRSIPAPQTARPAFLSAQATVSSVLADAEHKTTLGQILSDGTGRIWFTVFRSPTSGDAKSVISLGSTDALVDFDEPSVLGESLTSAWLDSDEALSIADANGGDDFLAAHPDADLSAVLTALPGVGGPDFLNVWIISYESRDSDDFLSVFLDAVTGGIMGNGQSSNAGFNNGAADAAAQTWSSDAMLVAVSSQTGVNSLGETVQWAFDYLSNSQGMGQRVFATEGAVSGLLFVSPDTMISLVALPDGWVNSTDAASVAEMNSGDFRLNHPDAFVQAVLATGLRDGDPDRTLWRFTYDSNADGIQKVVDVDALTGLVITRVERLGDDLPAEDVLSQNFPNPVSDRTRIPFSLAREGHVTLRVYNLLGKEVGRLVDSWLQPGRYTFEWNATRLPGGLYVVSMEISGEKQSRTLIVQR